MFIFRKTFKSLSKRAPLLILVMALGPLSAKAYDPQDLCDDILLGNVRQAVAGMASIPARDDLDPHTTLTQFSQQAIDLAGARGFPNLGPFLIRKLLPFALPLLVFDSAQTVRMITSDPLDMGSSNGVDIAADAMSPAEIAYIGALKDNLHVNNSLLRWEYLGLLRYLNPYAPLPILTFHGDDRRGGFIKDGKSEDYDLLETQMSLFARDRTPTTLQDIEFLKQNLQAEDEGTSSSSYPSEPQISSTHSRNLETHPLVHKVGFLTAIYRLGHNCRKGSEYQPKYSPLAFVLLGLVAGLPLKELTRHLLEQGLRSPFQMKKFFGSGKQYSIPQDKVESIINMVKVVATQIHQFGDPKSWEHDMQQNRVEALYRVACYLNQGIGCRKDQTQAKILHTQYCSLCTEYGFEQRKLKE